MQWGVGIYRVRTILMDSLEKRLQVATAAVAAFEAEPSFQKWRADHRKDGFLSFGTGLIAFGQELSVKAVGTKCV